jgi:alkanesulfonate monooxygenase SsuD/methylene tetrahydromethanopterin reductase-like flavin-dependent oxidoreductase (luciferase family)
MPHSVKPSSRRILLRVLAVTAGHWGLPGPIAARAWAQATGPIKPLTQLRIGYQRSTANGGSAKATDFEPVTLFSALSQVTTHIGFIATASTTYEEPYSLARK